MDAQVSTFIQKIREIADFLSPHIDDKKKGQKIWNGKSYAEYNGEEYSPDPYARLWYATLIVLAEMIERQSIKITPLQKEYLNRLLFGGMSSFNDFYLAKAFRVDVEETNIKLAKLRDDLHSIFMQQDAS